MFKGSFTPVGQEAHDRLEVRPSPLSGRVEVYEIDADQPTGNALPQAQLEEPLLVIKVLPQGTCMPLHREGPGHLTTST